MKHEKEGRLDWREPASFFMSSLTFCTVWLAVLVLTMQLNDDQFDQYQTSLKFFRAVVFILGFGISLPVALFSGVAILDYLVGFPVNVSGWLDGREAAADKYEESKVDVGFAALACIDIVCLISVSCICIVINYIWGEIMKEQELQLFLIMESFIALHALISTVALALFLTLYIIRVICKKYLRTEKVSPISDIESPQPKA